MKNSYSNGGAGSMHNGGTAGPSAVTLTGSYLGGVHQLREDPTKVFACA